MSAPRCLTGSETDLNAVETADPTERQRWDLSRRSFLQSAVLVGAGSSVAALDVHAESRPGATAAPAVTAQVTLTINGEQHPITLDTRTSLLDALREHLAMTGSKKGCDHGQCGACTVLLNGRRVNSCLVLAVSAEGDKITTIEGLAQGDDLSAVQQAFLDHDGYQCGYCTPGQICSATALLDEMKQAQASVVSFENATQLQPTLTDHEIRERMSGNICRCGAYPNIVAAVRSAAKQVSL